ncbi:MAG: phosphate signaling complex protein PhoU [Candidatus Methylacidiphilales bacterium]
MEMDPERLAYLRGVFKGPLQKLKDTLLMMASLTDRNMTLAVNSYLERSEEKAALVEAEDAVIDRLEIEVDDMIVTYVSTHGPMATTCRVALSASKISESLENIADQSVTIARRSRQLSRMPEIESGVDISRMSSLAIGMMRDSIAAFVEVNPEKAKGIKHRDKDVDMLNDAYEKKLNEIMEDHPELVQACTHTMLICRSLERAADYAKNIAEDVVFLYTAQDIRHGSNRI